MICHKKKFIFVHVPRTGGTSIEYFFDKKTINKFFAEKHSLHEQDLYDYSDYFSFSFVRNPWERMLSFYLFDKVGSAKYSLHGWLQLSKIRNKFTQSMSHYLIRDGNPRVNFIGRYENYKKDFDYICKKLNIQKYKLEVLNKTNHNYYTDYYDDKAKELVNKMFQKDIVSFNYEFGK